MARLFTSGQNRDMWFLTEDGLYEVLMQSRKPIAKQFKMLVTDSNEVSSKTSVLYLWTDKGMLRHAKILDNDKAWEVYEMLEDTYFNEGEFPLG